MPGTMHSNDSMVRRTALLVLVAALSACGGGSSSSDPPVEPSGQVINSTLRPESNGFTYAIQVFLPQSYPTGTTMLPVIYATDGAGGPGGTAVSRFESFKQVMQRRGTQAILVGIGGTSQRGTDFLLPGATRY